MELKRLGASDRGRITALFADVFTREPWNDDWSDTDQLNAYIADLTGQSNSLALGYFDGGRLLAASLGFVKHWFRGTEYIIDELFVDPCMQGQGIGSAFLRAMEAYLTRQGIVLLFLQTERTVPAYAFYLKHGFTELTDHVSFAKEIVPGT